MQNNLNSSWLTQIGLAYGTAGDAKLQGAIWDDADPAFDNYSYDYNVWHNRVAVKGKLIYDNNYWAAPYASGSAGVAFNRSYSYGNMPRTFNAKPNENFASHSKTAFTYTLGAGLQKSLNDKWQVGLGYEFADWGKSSLGRAFGQTLGSGLQLDHLYTNSVVFNLTYVV